MRKSLGITFESYGFYIGSSSCPVSCCSWSRGYTIIKKKKKSLIMFMVNHISNLVFSQMYIRLFSVIVVIAINMYNIILRTLGNVSHIVSVCPLIISIGRPLRSCQWVLLPSPESRPIHQQISCIAPISPFGSLVTRKFGRRLNDMTAVTRALYHFGVFLVYGLLIKPACNELSDRGELGGSV